MTVRRPVWGAVLPVGLAKSQNRSRTVPSSGSFS
jgi:hypothetical protein